MDRDEGKRFTFPNLMGCATGGLIFLWLFVMIAMAFGMSCQPDMPCWTDNRADLAIAFAVAAFFGAVGGWGTAIFLRWVASWFRS